MSELLTRSNASNKADTNFKKVMIGNFAHCPVMTTKVIRIFLSSTFSDMKMERNIIMKDVYSKIRSYCKERYGIEFQLSDMRWGIPSDTELDHRGPEICYKEIFSCQQISCGINFITIIGQRYGSVVPPYFILKDEFDAICSVLQQHEVDSNVLVEWYLLDENNLPAVYTLKPIPINIDSPTLDDIKQVRRKWTKVQNKLSDKINWATKKLIERGQFGRTQYKRFCCSVTEQEVELGICLIKRDERVRNTLVFLRKIEDIDKNNLTDEMRRYVDDNKKSNEESQADIDKFINESLINNVMENQIFHLSLKFAELNSSDDIRNQYVKRFKKIFYESLVAIIDKNMQNSSFGVDGCGSEDDEYLYNEVLQHNIACNNHVKHFQGRQKLLQKVHEYLIGPSKEPFVIFGESGSGKTSIMAKAAHVSRQMLAAMSLSSDSASTIITNSNPIIIIRFLGTTPGTSNIGNTFRILYQQLRSFIADDVTVSDQKDDKTGTVTTDFKELVDKVYQLLQQIAEFQSVWLFIDSVDQLQRTDGAYSLSWLKLPLPHNVKMVISTLPNYESILDNLRDKINAETNFLEVTPLNETTCMEILMSLLQEEKRTLNSHQQELVQRAFQKCSLPIYVHLLFRSALEWRSYFTADNNQELCLQYTVREAIFQFFRNLEKKHDINLVRHSLGFITASRNGLSEAELEDIMSLDDILLQKLFVYHLPPQIRVPPLLWTRLRKDIGAYLVEREVDNTLVLYWYHRQFIEIAQEYFLSNSEFSQYIHSVMADFYLGLYANGKTKRFYYPKYIAKKMNLDIYSDEDRKVTAQPLVYASSNQNADSHYKYQSPIFNYRRLSKLPWHLFCAGRNAEFADHVAFNYEFLLNKIKAFSRSHLLDDLSLLKNSDVSYKHEIVKLYNVLRMSSLSLLYHPNNLAFDLMGRLSYDDNVEYIRIQELLRQVRVQSHKHIQCLPVHPCMESGSGLVHCIIESGLSTSWVMPNNQILNFDELSNNLYYYDDDGNFIKTVELPCDEFESMVFLFRRPPIDDEVRKTIMLTVPYGVASSRKSTVKHVEALFYFYFYSGKLEKIAELKPCYKIYKFGDFNDVGEDYVLVFNEIGKAALIRIADQSLICKFDKGVKYCCLSENERYSCVLHETSNKEMNIYLYDLNNGGRCSSFCALPYMTFFLCFVKEPNILILGAHKDNVIYLMKYVIDDDDNDVLMHCYTYTSDTLPIMPFLSRDFYKRNSNFVVFCMKFKSSSFKTSGSNKTVHGYLYNIKMDTIVPLTIDPSLSRFRRHMTDYDYRTTLGLNETEEILVTTGKECLCMCWNTSNGQLLNVLTLGDAQGILMGGFLKGRSNCLVISHFPNITETKKDLYMLNKLINLDVLLQMSATEESSTVKRDCIKLVDPLVFNHPDYWYCEVNHTDELNGILMCTKKEGDSTYIIDCVLHKFISLELNHVDGREYLNVDIIQEYNDNKDVVVQITECNKSSRTIVVIDQTNKSFYPFPHFAADETLSNRTDCQDIFAGSDFESIKHKICFSHQHDWLIYLELIPVKLTARAFNVLNSKSISTYPLYNIEADSSTTLSRVLRRPEHCNHLIVVEIFKNPTSLADKLKTPRSDFDKLGPVTILECNIITGGNVVDRERTQFEVAELGTTELDMGTSFMMFDADRVLNYKMELLDIWTGKVVGQLANLDYNKYVFNLRYVGRNNEYVIGWKRASISEYYSIFSKYDNDNDDFKLLIPKRVMELYHVSSGQLVANYFFYDEVDHILILQKNTDYFCLINNFEKIKIIQINREEYSQMDRTIMALKHERYSLLRHIMSDAYKAVVQARPKDPITFISSFLREKAQ